MEALAFLTTKGVGEELLQCGGAHKPTHYDFGDGTVYEIFDFHDGEGVLFLLELVFTMHSINPKEISNRDKLLVNQNQKNNQKNQRSQNQNQ